MTDTYHEFLKGKRLRHIESGFEVPPESINPKLFAFQKDVVRWALKLGKAALFQERGLGKTPQQLEWARHVVAHTGGRVLILAPLAVAPQTVREGVKFDIPAKQVKEPKDIDAESGIFITNYERMHKFDPADFAGVVLDESGILKAFAGKTKRAIIDAFEHTPFKLACTATPAPNDYLELGNHAEFLDIMPSNEMIARWFINDSRDAGTYRLKGHAEEDFWRWLTSWAVSIRHPRDLGPEYDMPGYDRPPLDLQEYHIGFSEQTIERAWSEGKLMPGSNPSSTTLHKVKRESLPERIEAAREIMAAIPETEPVVIWCDTNYEADALLEAFPYAVEVRGNHSAEIKEARLNGFVTGEHRLLITKGEIAGFGMNWQHCNQHLYFGVSFSFEKFYQQLGRSDRYGQARTVHAHLLAPETHESVLATLKRKEEAFTAMQAKMSAAMLKYGLFRDEGRLELSIPQYERYAGDNWTLYQGDCVTVSRDLPDNSIDMSVYSLPFSSLYIYSDSEADMGNCESDEQFFEHYDYLVEQLYRITKPGRLAVVHCKDLPRYKGTHGDHGLYDFPGDVRAHHEKFGWQYHSRVTIWKDPVLEMQKTKSYGLLHKSFAERSQVVRQGLPDYLLIFHKPDDGTGVDIKHRRQVGDYIGELPPTEDEIAPRGRSREDNYSIAVWQRYASPVWFDIDNTKVLNAKIAKSDKDEKHLAPLPLQVAGRSIDLWSAPGEVVFSPFAGLGSEGWEAIRLGRQFIGIELNPNYVKHAVSNLKEIEMLSARPTLFEWAESQADSDPATEAEAEEVAR